MIRNYPPEVWKVIGCSYYINRKEVATLHEAAVNDAIIIQFIINYF